MKKHFYYIYLGVIISIILYSCQSTGNIVYGTNKSKTFSSSEQYLSENFEDEKIDTKKVYFLDSEQYILLVNEMTSNSLSMYYGVSEKYFVSGNQMTIESCSGQFQTLYKKVGVEDLDLQKIPLEQNLVLSALNLDPSKKTAIFLYSYKLGKFVNSHIYKLIAEFEKSENFDYRIISIDNLDILQDPSANPG